MEEGTDTTVYLPLKGIYQALPQNAQIEKIVITYTGNDFGIGEFLLRKDYNGDKVFKTLSVTLSGDENVTLAKYSATVSECENGAVAFDSEKYGEGAQATVTVTPEEGYQLLSLIVNGEDVTAAVNAGIYTFTITENATAVANFMPALTNDNFYFGGASIRWKKSTDNTGDGIRFIMLMEKSLYEALMAYGDVSFGTVLLPEDLLPEGQALTVDTALAKVTDTTEIWTEIDVDGKAYMSSIVYLWGIPEQSYSRGIFARGYIAIGEKYFYTAESEARSITYVAQKAYADSSTSEKEKGYCAAYFPVVTFDGGEGVGVMENVTLTDGVTYVLPTCSIQAPEGKTFGGYLVNGKTYAVGDEIVVSGKTVVTIVWL